MINWRMITALIGLLGAVIAVSHAQDQTRGNYPTRPIIVVSPYSAGGLGTLFVHLLSPLVEQRIGQPFVAEAKPGAGSTIGSLYVAQSPADGYTLLINSTSGLTTHLAMQKSPSYDPQTDLVPVALLADVPQVLVVNAKLPIHSLADISRIARTTRLTYTSAGIGTSQHLAGALLASSLGIELTHVPYRGGAQALQAVASGFVSMMFSDVLNALPFVESGKLRMIFVTSDRRIPAIPNIPSYAEVELRGFEEPTSFMILAPGKTPAPIVDKLQAAIRGAIQDPKLSKWIEARGLVPVDSPSPAQLQKFMTAQVEYWSNAVRKAGLAKTQ